jgi:hypothetical protein
MFRSYFPHMPVCYDGRLQCTNGSFLAGANTIFENLNKLEH